ncbi:ALF repeat-containing protein [Streptomyces sp. NBC_00038]|uniref:ALF repeat-containing protein n=1 Tax=Streptomyces sp. NBC_00038 TaxID=2903615 RepID=UPI002254AB50|nr:ALF repeat-containing protein [Streptomyces sp. NBC_00038]MCX5558690.1 ALF repeat-containing protein [Streptomyces sp. NBC_00038]
MRLTRAALIVTAGALAPALLLSTPAFAADTTTSPVTASATTDTVADSPYDSMTEEELRIEIARILADESTGKGVRREANEALDGTADDMRYFLETGRWIAQDEDNSFAIVKILADPTTGKAVRREANKALDGTPADRTYFLETGRAIAQAEDDRVAIATILANPDISAALRAAAEEAIDGTPEEMRYFLEVGQYEVDG